MGSTPLRNIWWNLFLLPWNLFLYSGPRLPFSYTTVHSVGKIEIFSLYVHRIVVFSLFVCCLALISVFHIVACDFKIVYINNVNNGHWNKLSFVANQMWNHNSHLWLLISSLSSDKLLWILRLGNPKLRDPYFLNLSSNVVSCLDPQQQTVWRKCVFLLKSTQSVLSKWEGDPHLWISGPSGRPQVCGVCRSSLLTHHKVVTVHYLPDFHISSFLCRYHDVAIPEMSG